MYGSTPPGALQCLNNNPFKDYHMLMTVFDKSNGDLNTKLSLSFHYQHYKWTLHNL